MKFNNISLQFGDQTISIVQHYGRHELICCEIAVIDSMGPCNPIEFDPDLESFMAALGKAMAAPKRDLSL